MTGTLNESESTYIREADIDDGDCEVFRAQCIKGCSSILIREDKMPHVCEIVREGLTNSLFIIKNKDCVLHEANSTQRKTTLYLK